jgi:tetratricopeptide (TPR) repeat protein
MERVLRAILLGVLCFSVATPARAIDEGTRAAVRDLAQAGVGAYQEGNYVTAAEKLDEAFQILPTAPIALWSARALAKQGKLVEAQERYIEATRAPLDEKGEKSAQDEARVSAEKERDALSSRIPRLTVILKGARAADVTLVIDEREIPTPLVGKSLPVNPGTVLVVVRKGEEEVSKQVVVEESLRREIEIEWKAGESQAIPTAAAAEEPREDGSSNKTRKILGWTGIGLGAVALGMGTATGIIAINKHSKWGCDKAGCPDTTTQDQRDQGNTLRTLSTIGFVAGGVLAATGITLVLLPNKNEERALYLTPGFGNLQVRGQF